MTLQSTLLFSRKAFQQRWVERDWLRQSLTRLSGLGSPRGTASPPPEAGRGRTPGWELLGREIGGLSEDDLRDYVVGVDMALLRREVPGYSIVPLGIWGAFMEVPGALSGFLDDLETRVVGPGRPTCGVGFWTSYLPGSKRPRAMQLLEVASRDELLTHVSRGESNVVHVLPRFPVRAKT